MRKCKEFFYAAVLVIFVFCLSGCSKTASVTEIPLGDDLPVWMLDEVHTVAELPDNAGEQGLVGIYTTDTDQADVYVYSFSKEDGVSLEEFGQQIAGQHHIFCNMIKDRGVPVAVLNYYDCIADEPYIVQTYIYETDDHFVEVRTLFGTALVPFGESDDLSIHMINGYNALEQNSGPLLSDTVYSADNDRLPQLRVRKFPKDDFPAEIIEPELLDVVSDREFAALAADGWSLDEFVSVYSKCFELLKGEVTCRNDLDHAFIGYIDDGIFCTRAFIDDGDVYVLLCAQAEASKFQHVTNALLDAVERTGN